MREYISLDGTWSMLYSKERPDRDSILPREKDMALIAKAVPGWWEDMYASFQMMPFWHDVCFNPEFKPLRYPMSGVVPDMVLDTIVGCFWYRKKVMLDPNGKTVMFKCGGVQNRALLWINGRFAAEHNGYCTPFEFDITGLLLNGENEFVLAVANHAAYNEDGNLISGITSRAANLYTGGITGSVSLELRDRDAVSEWFVSTTADDFTIHVTASGEKRHAYRYEIISDGIPLKEGAFESESLTVPRGQLALWSPESPQLYTLRLTLMADGIPCDVVKDQFGLRALTTEGSALRLNGKPVYLRGVCEHGYFAKSVHPETDLAYYTKIIGILKKLGFNFIRFHTTVPHESYLTAADRLGMLIHVESPNNTTEAEWADIVRFVRRHPSAVICCCGNELQIDDSFLEHLHRCADLCHELAPGMLFSPMSAMRGIEYYFLEDGQPGDMREMPLRYNARRMELLQSFCDVFSSYSLGHFSYDSVKGNHALVDSWAAVYRLPRLTHEICIHGTYADLDIMGRYEGTRIGETAAFSSIRDILKQAGLLSRAPLYYANSCRWQQLLRKHCFETTRLAGTLAGYDFLGDIDTHWHTFGYCVGMMNEFYEMKPGESVDNVLRYNNESVLLTDLEIRRCFAQNERLRIKFLVSLFGGEDLEDAPLEIRLSSSDYRTLARYRFSINASNGGLSEIAQLDAEMPRVDKPSQITIKARISQGIYEIENRWDIWVFPCAEESAPNGILCADALDEDILSRLNAGADVLLTGTAPFFSNPMSFRISLAGRTAGNLATVIEQHPFTELFEHEGWCGWAFSDLMDEAECLYYPPQTTVPFDPIIEVVSSYKWIRKQAALAELRVGRGRLLVCTFNLKKDSPAQKWWRAALIRYMQSPQFTPRTAVTLSQLRTLFSDGTSAAGAENNNVAANPNDKTMKA